LASFWKEKLEKAAKLLDEKKKNIIIPDNVSLVSDFMSM
jgi:hypothetical protein